MEKFAVEKFEEVIECYFLPGILGLLVIIAYLDSCITERLLFSLYKNLSVVGGLFLSCLTLIIGMIIDSTRHLIFERISLLKAFGISSTPILSFFDADDKIISINDEKVQWYRYFTRRSYYYSEFIGNIGLALLPAPLFISNLLTKYFSIESNWLIFVINGIVFLISITSLFHYILSMKTYSDIIKKIKNK